MRTRILSVTPINPLGVTAPLTNKGSQENGINAITGRGYNPSVFSACETSRKASSPCTGEPRRLRRRALNLQKCEPQLSPLLAGCSHPSRCSAKAPHSATFPKGKAIRFVCLVVHGGAEVRALYTAPFAKAGNKKPGGAGLQAVENVLRSRAFSFLCIGL